MSPHIHPINTMIPATRSTSAHRHSSPSPTANGTPPPTVTPSATTALLTNSTSTQDSQRLLKIRRFLGALVQFGQDTSSDQHVGDRLRSLVLSLAVSVSSQYVVFMKNNFIIYRVVVCLSRSFKSPFKKPQTSHCDQTSSRF